MRAIVFNGQGAAIRDTCLKSIGKCAISRQILQKACQVVDGLVDQNGYLMEYLESMKPTRQTVPNTSLVQVSMLALSTAHFQAYQAEEDGGLQKDKCLFLGHSLGEYSALVASGALDFERALQLVYKRGESMKKVSPKNTGMIACMGRNIKNIRIPSELSNRICLANYNAPNQVVLSGDLDRIREFCLELRRERVIQRYIELPVNVPFHSPLLQETRHEMHKILLDGLDTAHFDALKRVISNRTGKPYTSSSKQELADELAEHVVAPVQWYDSVEFCKRQGVDRWLCIGPGDTMANLIRRQYPSDAVETVPTH